MRREFAEKFETASCLGSSDTVSIGCAGTNDINEVSRLIALADNALYRAKHAGKDQVCSSDVE